MLRTSLYQSLNKSRQLLKESSVPNHSFKTTSHHLKPQLKKGKTVLGLVDDAEVISLVYADKIDTFCELAQKHKPIKISEVKENTSFCAEKSKSNSTLQGFFVPNDKLKSLCTYFPIEDDEAPTPVIRKKKISTRRVGVNSRPWNKNPKKKKMPCQPHAFCAGVASRSTLWKYRAFLDATPAQKACGWHDSISATTKQH